MPLYIDKRNFRFWYKESTGCVLHRIDGPAVEGSDGRKFWYINGKRHREDGAAFEERRGMLWFWDDVQVSNQIGKDTETTIIIKNSIISQD